MLWLWKISALSVFQKAFWLVSFLLKFFAIQSPRYFLCLIEFLLRLKKKYCGCIQKLMELRIPFLKVFLPYFNSAMSEKILISLVSPSPFSSKVVPKSNSNHSWFLKIPENSEFRHFRRKMSPKTIFHGSLKPHCGLNI